jgi:hypothetical protein
MEVDPCSARSHAIAVAEERGQKWENARIVGIIERLREDAASFRNTDRDQEARIIVGAYDALLAELKGE